MPNLAYNELSNSEVCSDSLISGQQNTTAWMLGIHPNMFVDIRKLSLADDFSTRFEQSRLDVFTGTSQFPVMYYGNKN